MTEPKIQNNNNITPKDLNLERATLKTQITDIREKFPPILDKIRGNFLNKYEDRCSELFKLLNQFNIKMDKYFKSSQEIIDFGKIVNTKLENIVQNLTISMQKCSEQIEILFNNLLEFLSKENLNDVEDYTRQMIEKKEKELEMEKENRRKLEEERKKKEEEEKKQLEQETTKEDIQINVGIKSIELDGNNNKENNIKLIENLNEFNQIILKDMSKEHLEFLFSKDIPEKKTENYNDYSIEINKKLIKNDEKFMRKQTFTPGGYINIEDEEISNNSIINIIFKNSNLENLNISKLFPKLKKLKIKDSKISFDIGNKFNLNNLQSLKLENIGLIDTNFNEIFDKLRNNKSIRNHLKIFSVKNNKISFIDYKKGYADNILSAMIFTKLEVLDMSYNRLYYFQNQIFNCLENIKFIDLTDNNISFSLHNIGLIKSAKIKNCLLLITRNLAILKENENIEYNKYLIDILPKINYPIKKIVFDNIFCGDLYKNIFDLDFSHFKETLKHLDLSNSQLHDNELISLFDNKWNFPNLKTLILNANYLTEEFIYKLSDNEKYKMDKLKFLRLSENQIKLSDLDKFIKFLDFFKNLEILELKCTPFESSVNSYFKKRVVQLLDPENKKGLKQPLNEEEKKIDKVLTENYLKEKKKLKIHILDLSGGKYTDKINQNLPELTERLNIENKFYYKSF
jgi:hypothetical protein